MKTHFPLLGILASLGLFALAAASYPGGPSTAAEPLGYDWTHDFICTLFAPTAPGGAANPARSIAIPAWLLFCVSIGVLFAILSRRARSKAQRDIIQIGGIGSAVYASLVVTPMHDLMVTIALLFFVSAALALLRLLHVGQHRRLLWAGAACLAVLTTCAVMYYGDLLFPALPVAQKLTFAVLVAWLLAVHYVVSAS